MKAWKRYGKKVSIPGGRVLIYVEKRRPDWPPRLTMIEWVLWYLLDRLFWSCWIVRMVYVLVK